MSQWKTHALAQDMGPQLDIKRRAKVVATHDLPDVPEGTPGVVILTQGFNWLRYRVRFANGVELGFLDADDITPR